MISSTWSYADLKLMKEQWFSKNFIVLNAAHGDKRVLTFEEPFHIEKLSIVLKNGHRSVIHRKVDPLAEAKNDADKQQDLIEVWDSGLLTKSINLMKIGKHREVYTDRFFGGFDLSLDGKQLAYVAEMKRPKAGSFFDKNDEEDKEETKHSKGDKYVRKNDWGESFDKRSQPTICKLDLETEEVTSFDTLLPMGDYCFGEPVWADDRVIYCVGFYTKPYRLGALHCRNRESSIARIDLDQNSFTWLYGSHSSFHLHSLSFSPNRKYLIGLQSPVGGPHLQKSLLFRISQPLSSDPLFEVLQIIPAQSVSDKEIIISLKEGVSIQRFQTDLWLSNDQIIFTSVYRSGTLMLLVNVTSSAVEVINSNYVTQACNVMTVFESSESGGHVVAALSALSEAPRLVLFTKSTTDSKEWSSVDLCGARHNSDPDKFPFYLHLEDTADMGWMLIGPKATDNTTSIGHPLLVLLHGGPHVVLTNEYNHRVATFVAVGIYCLIVNYRGSLGFSQAALHSVVGKIGTQDVEDCMLALNQARQLATSQGLPIDQTKLFVTGGSHGGFLSAHLIGQYPKLFRAAVIRNPVINMGSKCFITDMPDWNFVESGIGQYNYNHKSDPSLYATLWEKSPIVHVDNVKTPVLLALGGKDARVPPSNGLEYWRALEARGVPTKLLWYPNDSHSLSSIEPDADGMINTLKWFFDHL